MKLSERYDKKYLGRTGATILVCIAAVVAIVFACYYIFGKFSPQIELSDAVLESVSKTESTEGYIFRDETPVFASSAGGGIVRAVGNGDKVSAGQKIAEIYTNDSPEVMRRMAELDAQIELLEKSSGENRYTYSAQSADQEIYDDFLAIRESAEKGDLSGAGKLKSTVLLGVKRKEILTGENASIESQITELTREREALKTQLGARTETISAIGAGYYFSEYDGYGSDFSVSQLEDATFSRLSGILTSAEPSVPDKCVGTLVRGYKWYIACEVTQIQYLEENSTYPVFFPYNNLSLRMKLEKVVSDEAGEKHFGVFSCGMMPKDFDYTRKQPVRIDLMEYTGFRIPMTALRVVDGYQGVYIKNKVSIEFRRVSVIYEGDGYVICTGNPEDADPTASPVSPEGQEYQWIRQNDVIVVEGTGIYSGKVVD